MYSDLLVLVKSRAAAFWTSCNCLMLFLGSSIKGPLWQSSRQQMNEWMNFFWSFWGTKLRILLMFEVVVKRCFGDSFHVAVESLIRVDEHSEVANLVRGFYEPQSQDVDEPLS